MKHLTKTFATTSIALAGLFAGSLLLAVQADAHTDAADSGHMMQGMMGHGQTMAEDSNHQDMMSGNMMGHGEMMQQMQTMMAHCNRMMSQPDNEQH
ncbi:hypothetical protein [Phytohalomonas tamaricis]|uniref:hypothetical protein n=1 Tax=Phytohalomonas tamaricis TaxID=2081032 RepID=UPI000D0BCC2D|nr:hypothetical protein [Phytohalomonas tamaricis]